MIVAMLVAHCERSSPAIKEELIMPLVVSTELFRSYSDSALALKDKRGRAGRMRRDLADVGL